MTVDRSEERKSQEEEALHKLREEKAKQEEIHMQWRVFMHLRAELAEMERKEKMAKEKEKVGAVKRKLEFEEEETRKKEMAAEKRRKLEKDKTSKQKTPVRKKRKEMEAITIFSSRDDLPPEARRGRFLSWLIQLES